MSKKQKPYWIKERYNPQLGIYYVAMGQMSRTEARKHERATYGENVMMRYDTLLEYESTVAILKCAPR